MRRHAKASTAGSTQRQAGRLGHILRGALATRGVSPTSDGSGAPPARLGALLVSLCCALLLAGLLSASASAAPGAKGVVSWIGSGFGGLGGELNGPRGVAVNNASGDVYVVDGFNNRIQQFSSAGAFIRAWGFDVIQSGKPGDLGNNVFEICTVAANCKAGITSVSPAPGGEMSNPRGIAIDQATGAVYVSEQGYLRVEKFSSSGVFEAAFGKDVDTGGGTATEVCTVAANCKTGVSGSLGGEFGSTFNGYPAVAPTGAPNAGNVIVADPANRRVQEFSSAGAFVQAFGFDVAGAGAGADNTGAGFEVCTQAVAGAANCQIGTSGAGVGQFTNEQPKRVAEDTTGAIYAVESETNNRVQKFSPQVGPPTLSPSVFAAGQLSGFPAPTDVAVDTGNTHVYVTKPTNSPADVQVRELDSSGALQFTHGAGSGLSSANGLAVKASDGPIYQSSETGGQRVYVLNNLTPATAEMGAPAVDGITATSATLHGKVNPNGAPDVSYRFEYSLNGTTWTAVSTPDTLLGSQVTTQNVNQLLKPGVTGLEPNTLYHVRIVATRPFNPSVTSAEALFTTSSIAAGAETIGAPVRTATTALLNGRVNPFNKPTTYHFDYGTTEAYGQSTPTLSAGSGGLIMLVSEEITGLQPNTTYHYRVVADNGSPVLGEDMTVTTRVSDAPLTHGHFPGPPGSDRAWEQVNDPDTGGNTLGGAAGFSDDGNRALYDVLGGTQISPTGGLFNLFYSERTPTGWKGKEILPSRSEAPLNGWETPAASGDLSTIFTWNLSSAGSGTKTLWRLTPGGPPTKLAEGEVGGLRVSGDGSRVLMPRAGSLDPAHPFVPQPGAKYYYDITNVTPQLVMLLPDESVATCGVMGGGQLLSDGGYPRRNLHWVSEDGSRAFFATAGTSCGSTPRIYMRDFDAETTSLVTPPSLSGTDCRAAFIRANEEAVFFWTQSQLTADDTTFSGGCTGDGGNPAALGGDVYRYDIPGGSLDCVTCVIPGIDVDVSPGTNSEASATIGVAGDGSRVYFTSRKRLLPGAQTEGTDGLYRIDTASGDLAFVAPGVFAGEAPARNPSRAMTPDGSAIIFRSGNTKLNAIANGNNGGTAQYYWYDDRDRNLVCVSCPPDGSAPIAEVPPDLLVGMLGFTSPEVAPNMTALSSDGDFAFRSRDALVSADQNTARPGQSPVVGTDVYEWRDGRILLISDGLTNWPQFESGAPALEGISPSGRDVFFQEAARLTPDALDGFGRLYDARIGGGIEFPTEAKPCSLDTCQGTAKGAPGYSVPGTNSFTGPGDAKPRISCRKGRVRRKGRCVAKKRKRAAQHRTNRNRRNAR